MPFEIVLSDGLTGRITICNRRSEAVDSMPGAWELTVDGKNVAAGKFFTGSIAAGECKEFLLGVEVPPTYPGEKIFLNVELDGAVTALPLPVYMLKPLPQPPEYTVGLRADASQSMISGGKISAVITANGMRELRHHGDKLLASLPHLMLWQHDVQMSADIAALELDRIRISADRFGNDGEAVECHALALPRRMDLDELEFTQRFVPLASGAIRYETEFIVPESFAGVPRLGVEFALPETLKFSLYGHAVNGVRRDLPESPEAMEFAAFRNDSGCGLLIAVAGSQAIMQLLPYSEYELLDCAAPREDGKTYLTIDCRNAISAPIKAGRFRMALIFAPLESGEDAALKARSLRMF